MDTGILRRVEEGRHPRRAWHRVLCAALLVDTALGLGSGGCGFGTYDDTASRTTSANSGVPGSGQWWPWACPNGSNPSLPSTPTQYTVTGQCGPGGAFALSVDGCDMVGDWTVLGLSGVTTNIPSSIPAAGGWEVAGTLSLSDGGLRDGGDGGIVDGSIAGGGDAGDSADGGSQWTCDTLAAPSGALTFTCTLGAPAVTVCVSTLTPESP